MTLNAFLFFMAGAVTTYVISEFVLGPKRKKQSHYTTNEWLRQREKDIEDYFARNNLYAMPVQSAYSQTNATGTYGSVPQFIPDQRLRDMNRQWFEAHKHLTNEEMLDKKLIDECDIPWVNALRERDSNKT